VTIAPLSEWVEQADEHDYEAADQICMRKICPFCQDGKLRIINGPAASGSAPC
jgi:hypothetical protein